MSRAHVYAVMLVAGIGGIACHSATNQLHFIVRSAGIADSGRSVRYTMELRNSEAASIWLISCGGQVQPRFEYSDDKSAAGATGFTCDHDERVELAPGATFRDSGTVVRLAGAKYEPTLVVARSVTGRDTFALRGAKFVAP
jgi:hypothetical protein